MITGHVGDVRNIGDVLWAGGLEMARSYWLVKSEPNQYAWEQLVEDGSTCWDGVRNYEARNNLASMKPMDLVFYYHSNEGKEVVGVARVVRPSYPDPTTDDDRWVVVDIEPVVAFKRAVSLAQIKADVELAEMALVKRGRISVVPVTRDEFRHILKLGGTRIPRRTAA